MDIETQSELTQVETHSHAALHGSEDGSPTQNQESMPSLIAMVEVAKIVMPANVRPDWEHLDVLESSLRTNGQLQAIGVKPQGDHYVLLWGHNRLQAAKNLGWQRIRAAIRDYDDGDLRQELVVLEENLVRDELTVLERAEALGRQR